MNVSPAVSGLQLATQQFDSASQEVMTAVGDFGDEQGSLEPDTELGGAMVDMSNAELGYDINAKLLKMQDDQTKSILDLIA